MNIQKMREAATLIRSLEPPFKIRFESYRDGGTKSCLIKDSRDREVEFTLDNTLGSTTKGELFYGYPKSEHAILIEKGSELHNELGPMLQKYINRVYEDNSYTNSIADIFCKELNIPVEWKMEKEIKIEIEIQPLPYVRQRKIEATLEELICSSCGEAMERYDSLLMEYRYRCTKCGTKCNSSVKYPRVAHEQY